MRHRKLAIATVTALAGAASAPAYASGDTMPPSDGLDVACDAWFQRESLTQSFMLAQGFGENPDIRAWYAEEFLPVTQRFADHAPDELADEAATAVALTEQVATTGTPLALRPAAWDVIIGYLFDNCDGAALEVTMADYTFVGVPDSIPAGRIMFELTVPSDAEWHEMVVVGLDGPISSVLDVAAEAGSADPTVGPRLVAEALRAGEAVDTGLGYRMMPVYSLPLAPGRSVIIGGSFEPGEYALVCSFGEGTTRPDLIIPRFLEAASDPDVHSHADLGMLHLFTVE